MVVFVVGTVVVKGFLVQERTSLWSNCGPSYRKSEIRAAHIVHGRRDEIVE